MPKLDLTNAAFTGFRLTRRHPAMIAALAVIFLALSLAASVLMVPHAAKVNALFNAMQAPGATAAATAGASPGQARRTPLFAISTSVPGSPEAVREAEVLRKQLEEIITEFTPVIGVLTPLYLIAMALALTAVWRGVLAPQQGGPGFLRLGLAELRQLAVMLLIALFFTLAGIVGGIMAVIVSALVGWGSPAAGAFVFLLLYLAAIALAMMAMIRLSLAGPATFTQSKVQVFRIWALSKDRFWPLFGAYVLALIFSMLVGVLGATIFSGVAALVNLATGTPPPTEITLFPTSLAQLFTPLEMLSHVIGALFAALQLIISAAPAADLYRQITTGASNDAF